MSHDIAYPAESAVEPVRLWRPRQSAHSNFLFNPESACRSVCRPEVVELLPGFPKLRPMFGRETNSVLSALAETGKNRVHLGRRQRDKGESLSQLVIGQQAGLGAVAVKSRRHANRASHRNPMEKNAEVRH